jgi:hypothetical protein
MVTMLWDYPTEEQHSVVHFLWAKGLNAKDAHKRNFLFTAGSVCHVKWFTTESRNMANVLQMTKRLKRRCRSD